MTMKYKLLRFSLLSMLVMFFGAWASAQTDTYVVAGSPESIFGETWNATYAGNTMTKQADGTYAKTYANVPVTKDIQFKVVKNGSEWIGDETGGNVTFSVVSVCDVTISIDPSTKKISVTGDGVKFATGLEYESVYVAGDGAGTWLNGANWEANNAANKLTQIAPDVWEITYKDVAKGPHSFKFTIDGAWAHNFGGTFAGFGIETNAVHDGGNITFNAPEETQDITLRLDLSGFVFSTKQGAKFTVSSSAGAAEDIYVVAGEPVELFGVAWSATDENNQLTLDEATGLYTKTYENVELEAGTIYYKIVKNGFIWIPDGGDNLSCDIAEAGTYNVTVTFNPENEDINMTATMVTDAIRGITTESKNAGAVYNLNGQRVDDSYRGVIVRNGKKFVRK